MSTLNELLTPLTRAEVETFVYSAVKAKGTDHTSWKPGAFTRTMITVLAIIVAALSTLQVALAKSAFLGSAEGIWLTLLAKWVYGVDRDIATFAVGQVTLTNTGGGLFNVANNALIVSNAAGFKYRNTSSFTLNPGATLNVSVQAVTAGASSSTGVATLTKIESPSMTAVTVSNAAALVGLDEQSDLSLREECLASLGAGSPMGPSDAYEFVARNAKLSNGTPAGINRVKTLPPDGTGVAKVVVASTSGATTGNIGNLGTPLGAVHDALLRAAAPLCVDVSTSAASAFTFSILFGITMPQTDGRSKAELQAALTTAFNSATATVPIGGWNGLLPNLWFANVLKQTLPTAIHTKLPGDIKLTSTQIPVPTVVVSDLKYHAS